MARPSFLRGRPTWASAVYYQTRLTLPPVGEPAFLLASKLRLRGPRHTHTRADPFLFACGDDLYVFVETQKIDDPGEIVAYVSKKRGPFERVGTILSERFHLSYPHVFSVNGEIYLLPETQEAGALRLYKFTEFPHKVDFYRELLVGKYADPSPFLQDGVWYVFATSPRGLELFITDDLIDGALVLHPSSPITANSRYARCGGVPFWMDGRLIRPAQDCSERYGGNLNLMEIDTLSPTDYRERSFKSGIFDLALSWNAAGGHHVSVCEDSHGFAVAIDGQADDHFIYRILTRLWMKMTAYRRPVG